jgi:hypothetical protein
MSEESHAIPAIRRLSVATGLLAALDSEQDLLFLLFNKQRSYNPFLRAALTAG